MYVLEVLPLTPAAPAGTLSYRSAKKISPGSIVTVTLRRKRVPGVVVESLPAVEAKAALKAASFMVSGSVSDAIGKVPEALWDAAVRIGSWHATSTGSVLATLLQETLAEGGDHLAFPDVRGTGFSFAPVEQPLKERASIYRETVATETENGKAMLLVVSTLAEVEYWKRELADCTPTVLSGALTGARRSKAMAAARDSQSLVISTPLFAFSVIDSLGHIIVDRVGAGGFRTVKRPFLDMRVALMEYARACALPLTYGDFPLPLEYRADIRALPPATPRLTILDGRKDPLAADDEKPWSAVPEALRSRISEVIAEAGRVAVLAVRKGYSPVVVCRDCGQALKDERGSVFAFTQQGGERKFRTSDGTRELSSNMKCPNCDSWNLLPLGVGVERVVEELRAAFPNAPLVHFEADSVRTVVGARKRLAPLAAPGSIVVGTEAMVPWLLAASPAAISLAGIASADTLLALPFWRARERLVRLCYLLAATADECAISTRLPDDAAFKLLETPTDTSFFEEELCLRKALGYPPFGTLISLQFAGSVAALDQLEHVVRDAIGESHTVRTIPDRLIRGTQFKRTLVVQLANTAWPDEALSQRLAILPPSVRTILDPESFW